MRRRPFIFVLTAGIVLLTALWVQNARAQGTPSLSIDKRLVTTVLVAGELAEYSIKITNNGSGAAHNVVVSDVLPSTTSVYVRSNPVAATVGAPVTSLNWPAVATLAQGAALTYSMKVRLNTGAPPGTRVTNTASVRADGIPSISDNSVAPIAAPVIRLNPGIVTTPVVAGQRISFYAQVSNLGPGLAQDIRVSVRLDNKLQNPVAGNPQGSTYNGSTRTITWNCGNMAVNGQVKFFVGAIVNQALPAGFVVQANWTVKSTGMPDTTADQRIKVDQARAKGEH
jgi:uncharacterized repeat protein (TIGR01451 family)